MTKSELETLVKSLAPASDRARLNRWNTEIAVLQTQQTIAAARIKSLEDRPHVRYAGVWKDDGQRYSEGALVTEAPCRVAVQDTDLKPGIDHSGWRLIVKSGQA